VIPWFIIVYAAKNVDHHPEPAHDQDAEKNSNELTIGTDVFVTERDLVDAKP